MAPRTAAVSTVRLPAASALAESHPDHLATIGRLHRFTSQPTDHCRLLELHAGPDSHLLALAAASPESHFFGIPFSDADLDQGRALAEEVGLDNVSWASGLIKDPCHGLTSFDEVDYVLCQGLFPYLGRESQDDLLRFFGSVLSPRGMAVVSFNTEPGWCNTRTLREVVRSGRPPSSQDGPDAREARRTIERFAHDLAARETSAARSLADDAARILERDDGFLDLEILGPHLQACFFREFLERASERGLRYLADARAGTWANAQREPIRNQLERHSADPLAREQYLDLLRNRRLRRAILVRDDTAATSLVPDLTAIETLRGCARLVPVTSQVDLRPHVEVPFWPMDGGSPTRVTDPPLKALLASLAEAWPHSVGLADLPTHLVSQLIQGGAPAYPSGAASWGPLTLQAYTAGLIDLHIREPALVSIPGDAPKACPLSRIAARTGQAIHNAWGRRINVEPLDRIILALLDGQTDRAKLVERLEPDRPNGMPLLQEYANNGSNTREHFLRSVLEPSLNRLAANALLIA
jgi:hypothetical protein